MTNINWKTDTPTENGEYIVTRRSTLGGKIKEYVQFNYFNNGKWEIGLLDGSKVVAWYNIKNITPYKDAE